MIQLQFILPDGSLREETPSQPQPFRHISKEFNFKIPYEFLLIYDKNKEKLIGKNENLESGGCYKVIDARKTLETILKQDSMIRDFQQQISQSKDGNLQLLQQIKDENTKVKDENEKAKDENKQVKDQNEKLKDENQQVKDENVRLQKELENLRNSKSQDEELKKQISDFQQKFEDQKNQYLEEKRKNTDYKNQLEQSNNQKKELEQQKLQNLAEISNLKNQLLEQNLKQSIIQELKEKIKEYDKKFEEYLKQIFELKSNEKINEFKLEQTQTQSQKDLKNLEIQMLQQQKFNEQQLQQLNKEKEKLEEKLKKYSTYKEEAKNLRQTMIQGRPAEQEDSQRTQNLEQSIQQYQQQIQEIETENSNLKSQILELMYKYEQIQSQNSNLEEETNKMKQEYQEMKVAEIRLNETIKIQSDQISQLDGQFLKQIEQKEEQLNILKGSIVEAHYRHRLLRLVELIPRYYFSEIKFAIEKFEEENIYQKMNQIEQPMKYHVYQIDYKGKDIRDVLFKPSNLDITAAINLKSQSQYVGTLSQSLDQLSICEEMQEVRIIDQIQLFHCKQRFTERKVDDYGNESFLQQGDYNKLFAVRTIENSFFKQYESRQLSQNESKEQALKYISNLIASKEILKDFNENLLKFGKQMQINYQITEFQIFSIQYSFKEMIHKIKASIKDLESIPRSFHFLFAFVQELQNDQSNEFFEHLVEEYFFERKKQKPKDKQQQIQQKTIKEIFFSYIELVEIEVQIMNRIDDYSEEELQECIRYFFVQNTDFPNKYPYEIFYPAYEILFDVNQSKQLIKYNGGFLTIDESLEESSFYWALSYFSILRSNYQFCLSYLQQIDGYLYEPLVSSYDGFFNLMDQGLREITTIESKFLTSKYYPEWKDFFDFISKNQLD